VRDERHCRREGRQNLPIGWEIEHFPKRTAQIPKMGDRTKNCGPIALYEAKTGESGEQDSQSAKKKKPRWVSK